MDHPFIYSNSFLGIPFYSWSESTFLQISQNCNYKQAITSPYSLRNIQEDN